RVRRISRNHRKRGRNEPFHSLRPLRAGPAGSNGRDVHARRGGDQPVLATVNPSTAAGLMQTIARSALLTCLLFAPAAVPAAAQQPAADTAKKKEAALPLEPDRRLRYTAREGTWMSVSVSPDGQTLAFDLLGDLY